MGLVRLELSSRELRSRPTHEDWTGNGSKGIFAERCQHFDSDPTPEKPGP